MHKHNSNSVAQKIQYVEDERVSILLPLPLTGTYDYMVAQNMILRRGDIVKVPFGSRVLFGVVWGTGDNSVPQTKLKTILMHLKYISIPGESLSFISWVSGYTMSSLGAILRMVLSVPEAVIRPRKPIGYDLAIDLPPFTSTIPRTRILKVLQKDSPISGPELIRKAETSSGVLKGLLKLGVVKTQEMPDPLLPQLKLENVKPIWSSDQQLIVSKLKEVAKSKTFGVHVLDGVPGSGKTEVYFEMIAKAIKNGYQTLVLLPEISLSTQWRERFKTRFGVNPAEWHSDISRAKRREVWQQIAQGHLKVLVGARSALYLPFLKLGLIIIDEEHDASYKQEEGVIYNVRDMAIVRGRISNIPVILASATPSLETMVNISEGKYTPLYLPKRHGGAILPLVEIIDMRAEKLPTGRWISNTLHKSITSILENKQQALLFLNRRGYAPLTLCRVCGYRLKCSHCSSWLVEHRLLNRLRCHHCDASIKLLDTCPECNTTGQFAPCGPGVERLAEEASALFPNARQIIASSDTLKTQRDSMQIIKAIETQTVDLIIGTQIMSKGYHFPGLTLVGVIDADLGLSGGELRAAERNYQLLYQVAGRAGREKLPGKVMVQSFSPEHPVIKALAAADRDAFFSAEIQERKSMGMPPFGRLAAIIISSHDKSSATQFAAALSAKAPIYSDIKVLGPAPAPIAMIRGRHRQRLLLKVKRNTALQTLLKDWMGKVKIPKHVRVQIDIDPYNFM